MPAKKKPKKVHPVTPLDPDLEAQFRRTVEFYTSDKGQVIAQLPMPGAQGRLAEMIPKVMEAQLKMIDSYKQGALVSYASETVCGPDEESD